MNETSPAGSAGDGSPLGGPSPTPLLDPERLAALDAAGLLTPAAGPEFDRITRLVRRLLGVPVALVSFVGADRQVFAGKSGLGEPWASRGGTPLSHSFCQHVVVSGAPLTVDDALAHPVLCDNGAVRDIGVAAYLGVPVRSPGGAVLGALCAIDTTPRAWTDDDRAALTDLAASVEAEVALRETNATLEARVEERTREVREGEARVRALAQALALAEQEERRRIAYVLHDDLQQVLTGAQIAAFVGDTDRLRTVLARALVVTRTLSHELSPPHLDGRGLRDLLAWLAERERDLHRLDVAVDVRGDVDVADGDLRVLLYQLLRELLFNVSKHAGVDRARVVAERRGRVVRLTVEDDGAGFDPAAAGGGLGLQSVRERLALVGGRLLVESAPGAGTRVTVEAPAGPDGPLD